MRRRDVLRSAVISTAAVSGYTLPTAAERKSTTEEIKQDILQAIKLDRKHGSEAKNEYLEARDYSTTSQTVEAQIETPTYGEKSDEEPSKTQVGTQAIDDPRSGGIKVHIGAAEHYLGKLAAYLRVEYKFGVYCDPTSQYPALSYGEEPDDAVGIMWNSRQNEYFELADGGGESAMIANRDPISWDRDVHSPSIGRTGFRYSDSDVHDRWFEQTIDTDCESSDNVNSDYWEWVDAGACGVILDPVGNWDPSRRKVRAAYTHAHSNYNYEPSLSFSAAGPALSFTPGYTVTQTKIVTDEDGDNLEISQSDL